MKKVLFFLVIFSFCAIINADGQRIWKKKDLLKLQQVENSHRSGFNNHDWALGKRNMVTPDNSFRNPYRKTKAKKPFTPNYGSPYGTKWSHKRPMTDPPRPAVEGR